jgi:hypothetical protein
VVAPKRADYPSKLGAQFAVEATLLPCGLASAGCLNELSVFLKAGQKSLLTKLNGVQIVASKVADLRKTQVCATEFPAVLHPKDSINATPK